jgi:hypothetical protein
MSADKQQLTAEEIAALERMLGDHGIRSGARLNKVAHFAQLVERHGYRGEREILSLLDLLLLLRKHGILAIDETLRRAFDQPTLSFLRIAFAPASYLSPNPCPPGDSTMNPEQGPISLTVGQTTTASVVGFDQFGNPMPSDFVMPPVTFSIDTPAIASSTPDADGLTDAIVGVSPGVANLTASVSGPNGTLTDTETVTVIPAVQEAPVLSSVKVAFTEPA